MTMRGRPMGSGCDDAGLMERVRALVGYEDISRRAAIIRVCGIDQLRRIERKMTGSGIAPYFSWRRFLSGRTDGPDPATDAGRIVLVMPDLRDIRSAGPDEYPSNTLNPFTSDPELVERLLGAPPSPSSPA